MPALGRFVGGCLISFPALLAVAAGGAIGAVARHSLVQLTAPTLGEGFPVGHFLVNVSGSVLIGLLYTVLAARVDTEVLRLFLLTGVLGAFTTYSAFALDTLSLLERGHLSTAFFYALGSVLACVGGCAVGVLVGRAAFS
ncbi:MAG: fluoride efflux transporter CrcB [Gammaproteobacteria bacterium]